MFQLIEADNRLAALFNQYITHLQQIAEPLAPRISLRSLRCVADSPSFPSAAGVYYHCRVVAAALVKLHDAYSSAIAVLGSGAEPEVLREKVAPYFATPASVDERIGSAKPDELPNLPELLQFARREARALGLTSFGGGVTFRALPFGVAEKVRTILAEGLWCAEMFNGATTPADLAQLLQVLSKNTGVPSHNFVSTTHNFQIISDTYSEMSYD